MPARHPRLARSSRLLLLGALFAVSLGLRSALFAAEEKWVTAWTTAQFAETPGKDTPELRDATLRQVVRVTASGRALRVRIGNYFGAEPLVIGAARCAFAATATETKPLDWRALRFSGDAGASVAPAGVIVSDRIALPVEAGANLVVELYVRSIPATLTVHSAARSNSVVARGNTLDRATPAEGTQTFTRWYFLCGVDLENDDAVAVAILGDSIADGYGCPPDSYSRWPDVLARRLHANLATASLAVLNAGIGGNRLLRDGLGPRALSRVDRDVFAQNGVGCVVLCLGINDIGTRLEARKKQQPYATAEEIIGALRQLAERSRAHGLRVVGATMTPYRGADFYWSDDGEADRQTVNEWIRTSGTFDAVIDFDAALRDPRQSDRLAPAFDSGDHLHPSVAGYAHMAESVDLSLFAPPKPAALSYR